MDNKAQISVEMIIIMAALVAMAMFLLSSLNNTAKLSTEKLDTKTTDLLTAIDRIRTPGIP